MMHHWLSVLWSRENGTTIMPVHDWTRVSPNIFHDFHVGWMGELRRTLNTGLLPHDYFAAIEQQQSGEVVPDVVTLRYEDDPLPGAHEADESAFPTGTTAVAECPPQVSFTATGDISATLRRTLSIRHADDERIVALIEVLSPSNKRSRSELDRFLDKSASALREGLHLMLIDLFPPGRHDPQGIHGQLWDYVVGEEYHHPVGKPLTIASYSAGRPVSVYVEPCAIGDPLPVMPLFLAHGQYIDVPLEPTYQATWEAEPWPWQQRVSSSQATGDDHKGP